MGLLARSGGWPTDKKSLCISRSSVMISRVAAIFVLIRNLNDADNGVSVPFRAFQRRWTEPTDRAEASPTWCLVPGLALQRAPPSLSVS